MNTADLPRTADQWRAFLAELSAVVLAEARANPDPDAQPHIDRTRPALTWLDLEGTDEAEIVALEQRLGTRLPPSYRSFLTVSNGWFYPYQWEHETVRDVGWFRDTHPDEFEEYSEMSDDVALAEKTLFGRGLYIHCGADTNSWVLDPGEVSADGEWAAHDWAEYHAGDWPRYASFAELYVGSWKD